MTNLLPVLRKINCRKLLALPALGACCYSAVAQHTNAARIFAAGLDSIRVQLKIPGMAAAVQKGDAILLEGGFGYADVERGIKCTANTSFRVASVTKTFTSTLVGELFEQGKIRLNDPVIRYGVDLGNPQIEVRHLLTHTSEGVPGTAFQYNGYRYGRLGPVMEKAAGIPFYQLLMENLILPLKLNHTAPAVSLDQYYGYIGRNKSVQRYFDSAFKHLARPYELNGQGKVAVIDYLNEFGAFGGLATTVGDLLKYSTAIDRNRLVTRATQEKIFTANTTNDGRTTPYGLGWFVQHYEGRDYYWHYGQTQGESALFVKIPSLQLTVAVLCNTDKLSQPFPLGDGDLFMSPVGQLVYRCFVDKLNADSIFHNKELIVGATLAMVHGDTGKAEQIYADYARINFKQSNTLSTGTVIASITKASINKDLSEPFILPASTKIHVAGVGEDCSGDGSSWCDYGWIEDSAGKIIWQMQGQPFVPAGGAVKNQKVEQNIQLPAGRYVLRYKSDGGHAFNNWDSLPPDGFSWGIILTNPAP